MEEKIVENGGKFKNHIKDLREEMGLSQIHFSRLLGMSVPALSQMENGYREPTPEHFREMAKFFKCSTYEIINGRFADGGSQGEEKAV